MKFPLETGEVIARRTMKLPTKDGEVVIQATRVHINPPNMRKALFKIEGLSQSPLVVHRFSAKVRAQMLKDAVEGKPAGSKKKREPLNVEETYNNARYYGKTIVKGKEERWDGFNASAIRGACIRACSLVGFKMVLAKLSIFVEQDGWDLLEPQIPLVRIYGDPVMQQDIAYTSTGQPYVTIRPAYHNWHSMLKINWDADQFTSEDVSNLLARAGLQVGICEGRPGSKNSCGMGWGRFSVVDQDENLKS